MLSRKQDNERGGKHAVVASFLGYVGNRRRACTPGSAPQGKEKKTTSAIIKTGRVSCSPKSGQGDKVLLPSDYEGLAWYLIRTKPKKEGATLEALRPRGVEVYCPRILEPPSHYRAPRGPVPLFPGYLFVYCQAALQYRAITYCPGVARFVRFGSYFAAVEPEFIAFLRQHEDDQGTISLPKSRSPMPTGTRARVVAGPLRGYEGIVERYLPARDRVRLLLQLVFGTRTVEVDASSLRPLK